MLPLFIRYVNLVLSSPVNSSTNPIVLVNGDSITQWLAYVLLDPAALGLTPSIEKISAEKNVNVAEVNTRRYLEESGQWLENVH